MELWVLRHISVCSPHLWQSQVSGSCHHATKVRLRRNIPTSVALLTNLRRRGTCTELLSVCKVTFRLRKQKLGESIHTRVSALNVLTDGKMDLPQAESSVYVLCCFFLFLNDRPYVSWVRAGACRPSNGGGCDSPGTRRASRTQHATKDDNNKERKRTTTARTTQHHKEEDQRTRHHVPPQHLHASPLVSSPPTSTPPHSSSPSLLSSCSSSDSGKHPVTLPFTWRRLFDTHRCLFSRVIVGCIKNKPLRLIMEKESRHGREAL